MRWDVVPPTGDSRPRLPRRRSPERLAAEADISTPSRACEISGLAAGLPSPDSCLIIDVAMPEMDGLQLQAELKRLGSKAPVIFITALDDPGLRERAKQAGAVAFFQKPVDSDALVDAIKWALTEGKEGARDEGRPAP